MEPVAQLVEHRTFNPLVVGSIPTGLATYNLIQQCYLGLLYKVKKRPLRSTSKGPGDSLVIVW